MGPGKRRRAAGGTVPKPLGGAFQKGYTGNANNDVENGSFKPIDICGSKLADYDTMGVWT